MTDSFSVNPLKINVENEKCSENQLSYILTKIQKTKYIILTTYFMNMLFVLWCIFKLNSLSTSNCEQKQHTYTPIIDDTEIPDISTSNAKHVVNLLDFENMEETSKDDILNNIDSIIVTDSDVGATRHQISKAIGTFF